MLLNALLAFLFVCLIRCASLVCILLCLLIVYVLVYISLHYELGLLVYCSVIHVQVVSICISDTRIVIWLINYLRLIY